MQIDSVSSFAELGRAAEADRYPGLRAAEFAHDPFLPLIAAAGATSTLQLGTAITVPPRCTTGARLNFRGDFYTNTLMTPFRAASVGVRTARHLPRRGGPAHDTGRGQRLQRPSASPIHDRAIPARADAPRSGTQSRRIRTRPLRALRTATRCGSPPSTTCRDSERSGL